MNIGEHAGNPLPPVAVLGSIGIYPNDVSFNHMIISWSLAPFVQGRQQAPLDKKYMSAEFTIA